MKKVAKLLAVVVPLIFGVGTGVAAEESEYKAHIGTKIPDVDAMEVMRYSNPALPNMMMYVQQNRSKLAITDSQSEAIKSWVDANRHEAHAIASEIMTLEREVMKEALTKVGNDPLVEKFNKALDLRRELAKRKMACRMFLRSILTLSQWETLVKIYKHAEM